MAVALLCATFAASAAARAKFDIRLLARIGPPGYPAISLVAPDRTIYVSTFNNPQGSGTYPSKVFAFGPNGNLLRTYTVTGQNPNGAAGVQVAARDAAGNLYLLDQNPARVVILDPRSGRQTTYATFKDVPTCATAGGGECSDTVQDNPPEPDYAAWGTDGSLYVTDYQQGLIWRVPPGGGQAHVWFTDPQLDGTLFGPAQIVMMPDHHTLMLDTSAGGATSVGDPTTGKLYTLPILANGRPGALHKLWESGPREGPDGFALAASGDVYMALVGPGANQLVEISPQGQELGRAPTAAQNSAMNPPFDEPSSVAFDGDRMIVTNDAYFSGDSTHWAIFDVFAGEPGAPIYVAPTSGAAHAPTGGHTGRRGPRYALRVGLRFVHSDMAHNYRFTALVKRGRRWRPLRHALVVFDGRRRRTDRHGHVTIVARLRSRGRYAAVLKVSRRPVARAFVHVLSTRLWL
jgi:sugar lactone lactonase YvrE